VKGGATGSWILDTDRAMGLGRDVKEDEDRYKEEGGPRHCFFAARFFVPKLVEKGATDEAGGTKEEEGGAREENNMMGEEDEESLPRALTPLPSSSFLSLCPPG